MSRCLGRPLVLRTRAAAADMLSSPRQRASSNARKVSELERASDPASRGGSAALGDADQSYDPKAKPSSPPSSKPRQRQWCGQIGRVLKNLFPEVTFLLLFALTAVVVCAALPHGSALVGAFLSMATVWGVIFAVGLPLLLLHAARLFVVLLCLAWSASRSACRRRKEPAVADDRAPPGAIAAVVESESAESESDAGRGAKVDKAWVSRAIVLIIVDVLLGVAIYVAMGVATTVSWSRCAPYTHHFSTLLSSPCPYPQRTFAIDSPRTPPLIALGGCRQVLHTPWPVQVRSRSPSQGTPLSSRRARS